MRTYLVVLPGEDDSCGDEHAGNAEATANVESWMTESITNHMSTLRTR